MNQQMYFSLSGIVHASNLDDHIAKVKKFFQENPSAYLLITSARLIDCNSKISDFTSNASIQTELSNLPMTCSETQTLSSETLDIPIQIPTLEKDDSVFPILQHGNVSDMANSGPSEGSTLPELTPQIPERATGAPRNKKSLPKSRNAISQASIDQNWRQKSQRNNNSNAESWRQIKPSSSQGMPYKVFNHKHRWSSDPGPSNRSSEHVNETACNDRKPARVTRDDRQQHCRKYAPDQHNQNEWTHQNLFNSMQVQMFFRTLATLLTMTSAHPAMINNGFFWHQFHPGNIRPTLHNQVPGFEFNYPQYRIPGYNAYQSPNHPSTYLHQPYFVKQWNPHHYCPRADIRI